MGVFSFVDSEAVLGALLLARCQAYHCKVVLASCFASTFECLLSIDVVASFVLVRAPDLIEQWHRRGMHLTRGSLYVGMLSICLPLNQRWRAMRGASFVESQTVSGVLLFGSLPSVSLQAGSWRLASRALSGVCLVLTS